MKKFLTVLLALSVVFTYTVGTAFAAAGTPDDSYTAAEVEAKLYDVISGYEKGMTGNIDRVVDYLIKNDNIDDESDYEIIVKKEAYEQAATDYIGELIGELEKVADAEVIAAESNDGYNSLQLKTAILKITDFVEKSGAKPESYHFEKVNLTPAESVVGKFTYDVDKKEFVPAVGVAEKGTVYFTLEEYTFENSMIGKEFGKNGLEDNTWFAVLKNGHYVHPTNNKVERDTTYYKQIGYGKQYFEGDVVEDGLFSGEAGEQVPAIDKNAQPGTDYWKKVIDEADNGVDLSSISGFATALEKTVYIAKAEAPKAYEFYLTQIEKNYPLSNYPETGNYTYDEVTGLTAKEAIEAIKSDAVKAIKDAEAALKKIKNPTKAQYEDAINAYETAYEGIAAEIEEENILNNEQIEDGKTAADVALDAAIAALRAYALGQYRTDIMNVATPQGTDTADLSTVADNYGEKIYDKKASTLFGVKVKDIKKATRAEVLAVKSAFNKAMNDTVDTVKKSVEAKAFTDAEKVTEAVEAYYDAENAGTETVEHSLFTTTVEDAYKVSSIYDAVVARGEALKKAMHLGKKVYDDAKVDEVVAAAESCVYADMGTSLVDEYFVDAINKVYKETYDRENEYYEAITELLIPGDFEYDKLLAAIEEAKDKFQPRVITIGANTTPEADKVFCKNFYAVDAKNAKEETYGKLYDEIETKTKEALDDAQSYADIEAAMTAAKADLAKLMLAANEDAVKAAREVYVKALAEHKAEVAEIKGSDYKEESLDAAETAGLKLINNAITVDAVKAAYADAKALFDDMKTIDELAALKEAVEKELKALPLASAVTEADAAAIEAARASYDAYMDEYGAEDVATTAKNRLVAAEKALYTIERDAINEEIKAVADKLEAIDHASQDVAVAELVALKAELTAVAEKAEAFNDKMDDLDYKDLKADNIDDILAALKLNDKALGTVWGAEVYLTEVAILKVLENADVNMADVNAAFDAYNALTDRQQYKVDKDTNYAISMIKAKMINAVEAMKVVKAHSAAGKGYIKVMWEVVGNETAIDGFQVYKSTKAQTGYTFMGKTTKHYMTNKKGLKKGKRFYYKVRAYKVIDGTKYFSDWSNKANRIYK